MKMKICSDENWIIGGNLLYKTDVFRCTVFRVNFKSFFYSFKYFRRRKLLSLSKNILIGITITQTRQMYYRRLNVVDGCCINLKGKFHFSSILHTFCGTWTDFGHFCLTQIKYIKRLFLGQLIFFLFKRILSVLTIMDKFS